MAFTSACASLLLKDTFLILAPLLMSPYEAANLHGEKAVPILCS